MKTAFGNRSTDQISAFYFSIGIFSVRNELDIFRPAEAENGEKNEKENQQQQQNVTNDSAAPEQPISNAWRIANSVKILQTTYKRT